MARYWNHVVFEREIVTKEPVVEAFQEIVDGKVVRYVDEMGQELFVEPPQGLGSRVLMAEVQPPVAVENVATARDAAAAAAAPPLVVEDATVVKTALSEAVDLLRAALVERGGEDPILEAKLTEMQRLADAK